MILGKAAEALAEYLVKGKQLYVEGRLQTRQWDDKNGTKRYTTEIRRDRVLLLGDGSKQPVPPHPAETEPASAAGVGANVPDDSDIPFSWVIGMVIQALWSIHSAVSVLS